MHTTIASYGCVFRIDQGRDLAKQDIIETPALFLYAVV